MPEQPNDRIPLASSASGPSGAAPQVGPSTRFQVPDKEVHLMTSNEQPAQEGGSCSCNAVCTCVPVSSCSCDAVCTCDSVCTCQSVCQCHGVCSCQGTCACDGNCSCNSQGSHYWYPN